MPDALLRCMWNVIINNQQSELRGLGTASTSIRAAAKKTSFRVKYPFKLPTTPAKPGPSGCEGVQGDIGG